MLNDWPFWTHQSRSENKMFVHWILILKVKIFMDQTYDLVRLGYDGILLRSVSFLVLSDPFKYDSVKNLLYNCRVKLLLPYCNPINHVESSGHRFTISLSPNYHHSLTHESLGPRVKYFTQKYLADPINQPDSLAVPHTAYVLSSSSSSSSSSSTPRPWQINVTFNFSWGFAGLNVTKYLVVNFVCSKSQHPGVLGGFL